MKNCNWNTISKYIRIALSLVVIAIGIIYQNWLGLFGLLTLASALSGAGCPWVIRFNRDTGFTQDEDG
jgi:uncharacterized protein (DUF58 family)